MILFNLLNGPYLRLIVDQWANRTDKYRAPYLFKQYVLGFGNKYIVLY